MNENIKNKISKSRIKFLKENPDKHPWKRSTKFKSEPCEHLKQLLKDKSYTFEEEFTDARWNHCYSLDIAFIDKKLAIEVNGNQHYKNDGTLTDYYQNRHDYLTSQGWNVLDFDNNTHILISAGQVLKKAQVEGSIPSRSTLSPNPPLVFLLEG